MALNKIKLAGLILILLIPGCVKKDELTRPTRIRLTIKIIKNDNALGEYFGISWGYLGVRRIQFEGKREAGEDILFETDPEANLLPFEFEFESSANSTVISEFDIPQGIYNYMRWDLQLKSIQTSWPLIVADSASTGLVISGYYEYLNERQIPFCLYIDDKEQFRLMSFTSDGNSTSIVISESKVYEALLSLDLWYAFRSISRESFEKAEISNDIHYLPIIAISINKNKYLYDIILNRISQSARVIFN